MQQGTWFCNSTAREKEEDWKKKEKKGRGKVGMLIFLVRNVRFGDSVGWPSAN